MGVFLSVNIIYFKIIVVSLIDLKKKYIILFSKLGFFGESNFYLR